MIDFKEAFQQKPNLVPPNIDDNSFWARSDMNQAQELPKYYSVSTWTDTYISHQRAQSSKMLSNLNALLEEYEVNKAGGMMKKLASELEKQDLLLLLPGVVYGYALRNRKWCKFTLP
jgi:hypothetical protein